MVEIIFRINSYIIALYTSLSLRELVSIRFHNIKHFYTSAKLYVKRTVKPIR